MVVALEPLLGGYAQPLPSQYRSKICSGVILRYGLLAIASSMMFFGTPPASKDVRRKSGSTALLSSS